MSDDSLELCEMCRRKRGIAPNHALPLNDGTEFDDGRIFLWQQYDEQLVGAGAPSLGPPQLPLQQQRARRD